MKSIQDIIDHYSKEDDPLEATFNKVSDCCHRPIAMKFSREFPLGGVSWGISTKEAVCECCGKDCAEVDQCEICGVVGCLGDCEANE